MKLTLALILAGYTALSCAGLAHAATADNRDVVRDKHGQVIHSTFGLCVRTKWVVGEDACAAKPQAQPQPQAQYQRQVIAQEERTVYFGFNLTTLTAEAKSRLNSLAEKLKSDTQVREARIVGYADRIGSVSYNDRLSQRRAETVRNYLTSRGYVNSRVTETRWFGEKVPATSCPDNLPRAQLIQCLQRDRRVEVEVEYLPENGAR